MSDAAIRQAERAWRADPTEDALTVWTTALVRAGRDTLDAQVEALRLRAVPADRLTLAARLGDARALRLVAIPASGTGGPVDWSVWSERRQPRMQHPGASAVLREVERFAAYECKTAEERIRAWTLGIRLAEVVATALEDRTAAAVAEWLREVAGGGPGEATVPQAAALADRIERGEWREA